jgi:hypothetical protein
MSKLLFANVKDVEKVIYWNMLARVVEGDEWNVLLNTAPRMIDTVVKFSME